MVFDVTRRRTFLNIENWKNECFDNLESPIPLVVVANKVDLEDSRAVSREDGEEYAEENKFLYVESSALTGENVEEAYAALCRIMIKDGKSRAEKAKTKD